MNRIFGGVGGLSRSDHSFTSGNTTGGSADTSRPATKGCAEVVQACVFCAVATPGVSVTTGGGRRANISSSSSLQQSKQDFLKDVQYGTH